MSCGFDQVLLSRYSDGALEREEAVQIGSHIAGCEECRRALEAMRHIDRALHSLPRKIAPAGLIGDILAEAEDPLQSKAWQTVRRTVSAVCVAATDGFRIGDEQEEVLRRELPELVTRWIFYV